MMCTLIRIECSNRRTPFVPCIQEIQLLTGSMQQLKVVQVKFKEAKDSLVDVKKENEGMPAIIH